MNKVLNRSISLLVSGILLAVTVAFAADEPLPEGIDAPYGLAETIIPKADFELGNDSSWVFPNNNNSGVAAVNYLKGDPERGGYVQLMISSDGSAMNAFQPNKETNKGPLTKGEKYVASFYAKTNKVNAYTINSIWLRDLRENRNIATKRLSVPLICDGQWHYYAVVLEIGETVDQAKFMMQWGGQGKSNFELCLDEIKLRPVRTEPPIELAELTAGKKAAFTDINGHWAEDEIREMASFGIINGRDAKTFDPEAAVTRAEFVSMLVRAMGFREARSKNPFRDSKRTDWYVDALDIVADCEIIDSGMLWQGNFFGDAELKREELAMFLANSYDKMLSTTTNLTDIIHFTDRKEITDWAIPYIMRCTVTELMEGVEWNLFEPQGTVTRAQAATAIYRLRTTLEKELS